LPAHTFARAWPRNAWRHSGRLRIIPLHPISLGVTGRPGRTSISSATLVNKFAMGLLKVQLGKAISNYPNQFCLGINLRASLNCLFANCYLLFLSFNRSQTSIPDHVSSMAPDFHVYSAHTLSHSRTISSVRSVWASAGLSWPADTASIGEPRQREPGTIFLQLRHLVSEINNHVGLAGKPARAFCSFRKFSQVPCRSLQGVRRYPVTRACIRFSG